LLCDPFRVPKAHVIVQHLTIPWNAN